MMTSSGSAVAADSATGLLLVCTVHGLRLYRRCRRESSCSVTFDWMGKREGPLHLAKVWQHARLARRHHCIDCFAAYRVMQELYLSHHWSVANG